MPTYDWIASVGSVLAAPENPASVAESLVPVPTGEVRVIDPPTGVRATLEMVCEANA